MLFFAANTGVHTVLPTEREPVIVRQMPRDCAHRASVFPRQRVQTNVAGLHERCGIFLVMRVGDSVEKQQREGMAIDTANSRLFVGCRGPQKLIVMSTK